MGRRVDRLSARLPVMIIYIQEEANPRLRITFS